MYRSQTGPAKARHSLRNAIAANLLPSAHSLPRPTMTSGLDLLFSCSPERGQYYKQGGSFHSTPARSTCGVEALFTDGGSRRGHQLIDRPASVIEQIQFARLVFAERTD